MSGLIVNESASSWACGVCRWRNAGGKNLMFSSFKINVGLVGCGLGSPPSVFWGVTEMCPL